MPKRADKFPDGVLIPAPQAIVLHEGKITAQAIQAVNEHLSLAAAKLNGGISVGDGISGVRSGNIDGRWVTVLTPSVASTEFAVYHNLGRVPVAVLLTVLSEYAQIKSSSEGSWGPDVLFLKCDASGVTIRLLIL